MPTRNVVLSENQQRMIESLVGSGRYQNASEVMREGLRLVAQREAEDVARIKALSEAAGAGWRDLGAGRYRDLGEDQLADHIADLGARAAR